jgi:acetate kinase
LRVLVVNAGSSSLKLSILDGDELVWSGSELGEVDGVDAVGHRIVHGGTEFVDPVLIDAAVVRRLEALTDLAPLHQPKSLRALDLVGRALPDVPAVACFDTAFHARIPAAASTYALPREWRTRWDLRKFGFHGLSHEYASSRALELAGAPADARVVTCHLGAGASLAAVRDGRSVDTTMGFTPLDGLVMATRSGEVDPGLILWLEEHMGMPPSELASTLEHRSGLLGLTGTADMKEILEREASGDEQAALAIAIYVHRLRGSIAAMAAALGGLDVLVFTGGVGERSAPVRARAAEGLGFLGVAVDSARNEAPALDAEIGSGSVRVFVVAAREDLQIARGVRSVLG